MSTLASDIDNGAELKLELTAEQKKVVDPILSFEHNTAPIGPEVLGPLKENCDTAITMFDTDHRFLTQWLKDHPPLSKDHPRRTELIWLSLIGSTLQNFRSRCKEELEDRSEECDEAIRAHCRNLREVVLSWADENCGFQNALTPSYRTSGSVSKEPSPNPQSRDGSGGTSVGKTTT